MNIKEQQIILFISNVTNPGGTIRVVTNLANSFYKHGLKVKIISINSKEGVPFYPVNPNIEIRHLNAPLPLNVLKRISWGYYKTIREIVKNIPESDAVLIATDPITCYSFPFIKKIKPRNKYIATEHLGIAIAKKYSILARKLLYRKLNAVVVLTQTDKDLLLSLKIKMKTCRVIPNEVSFYPPTAAKLDSKILLSIGKYEYQKGYDLLVEIVSAPLKKHRDWKLILVGKDIVGLGDAKKLLLEKIDQYHLQNQVILVPPTQNIVEEYLNASIYLMSSRFEGFPMVLLEAKACGLPVISYDCPAGPAEIIEPDDGILIPFMDAKAFETALLNLMENEEKRKTMGENARRNVWKYNSDAIYKKWEELFNALA
jgi:glycosyltransferase involved in cell wall biosynthesis